MEENKNEIVVPNSEVIVLSERQSRAVQLHGYAKSQAQIAENALFELGKALKELRDEELYKELDAGYESFDAYCRAEYDMSERSAYYRIGIIENLPEDFLNARSKIGFTKFRMIAFADEPVKAQIMQQDDLETISSRQLEIRIKELTSEISGLKNKQKQAESRISELESENQDKQDKIISLERQNEELENQPRDTVFENDPETLEEIERLKAQNETLAEQKTELELKIWDYENQEQAVSDAEEKRFAEFTSNMNQQLVEERQRVKEEAQEEISRANLQRDNAFAEVTKLREQLALAKKPDTPEESPETKQFRSQLGAVGICMKQLVDFLIENPDTAFLNQSETALRGVLNNLDEIRKQVQT